MPRAERIKRKRDEELHGAAAKVPKLTSFFKPSITSKKSGQVQKDSPSSAVPEGPLFSEPSGGTICPEPSESSWSIK